MSVGLHKFTGKQEVFEILWPMESNNQSVNIDSCTSIVAQVMERWFPRWVEECSAPCGLNAAGWRVARVIRHVEVCAVGDVFVRFWAWFLGTFQCFVEEGSEHSVVVASGEEATVEVL